MISENNTDVHHKKIALFLPNLNGGGAEKVMHALALGMSERGIGVDVVLVKKEGIWCDNMPQSVRVIDLGARGTLAAIRPLSRYLRDAKPAALLSALDHANLCALMAKRLSGGSTRIVIAVHEVHLEHPDIIISWKGRLVRKLMRWCYTWADAIVAVSRGTAEAASQLTRIPSSRIRVIYNPAITPEMLDKAKEPLDNPWFAPGQPPVVLCAANLRAIKDLPTLLRAFSIVRKKQTARLVILGEGSERGALEALARELNIQSDVSLPGFVNNPYSYMSQAAVLALSSKFESLSNVLIEALALGTPVVSTDCDFGPREVLSGGQYGALTPVGDPSALAAAILNALAAPRQIVHADFLERFTIENAVRDYLDVLLGEGIVADCP